MLRIDAEIWVEKKSIFTGLAEIKIQAQRSTVNKYFKWVVMGEGVTYFRTLLDTSGQKPMVEIRMYIRGHFIDDLALHEIVNHNDTSCSSISKGVYFCNARVIVYHQK